MITLHAFIFPTAGPYLLYGVPERLINFPLRLGYAYIGFGIFANGACVLLALYIALGLSAFFTFYPLLKELKLGLKEYKTQDNLRSKENLVHGYRCLQIFMGQINRAISNIFVPFEVIFGNLSLFCSVTLTLFAKNLGLDTVPFMVTTAAFAIFGFAAFFTLAGILNVKSRKAVMSWKVERWEKRSDKMYVKRVKKSCREISVQSWGMMRVRPVTAIKYVNSTGKATFRAILMLRKALVKN